MDNHVAPSGKRAKPSLTISQAIEKVWTPSGVLILVDLGSAIREAVVWEEGSTTVEHDATQALAQGRGVCQDHAHLFTSVCRLLGLPARYVSGYFHTGEASPASHAWGEAWLGAERGWFSVDITHGTAAGERHCRLAVGRESNRVE